MTKDAIRAAIAGVTPGPERARVVIALAGHRQVRVAKKAGMSDSLLSLILNGHRPCIREQQRAIAKALGFTVDELFGAEVAA
jgi:transcriptional regulator with XRE-family HTH domain